MLLVTCKPRHRQVCLDVDYKLPDSTKTIIVKNIRRLKLLPNTLKIERPCGRTPLEKEKMLKAFSLSSTKFSTLSRAV